MAELVAVDSLEFDPAFYPRMKPSDYHIHEIVNAMEGGNELPPIVADRATRKIIDGVHRWNAAIKRELAEIAVEWRDYTSETEMFKDAVLLNSVHGLNFGARDKLKVIEIGQQFGLKEIDVAGLLRTSESYIKAIMPRYATVQADAKATKLERLPLKASTRHLSGQTITPAQADAIRGNAPGTSYLLVVRQLLSAVKNDLLPPAEQNPVLWGELTELRDALNDLSIPVAAE